MFRESHRSELVNTVGSVLGRQNGTHRQDLNLGSAEGLARGRVYEQF